MSSNILRFPGSQEKATPSPAPVPPIDVFDTDKTRTLADILGTALFQSKILIDFLHQDRAAAAAAGLEGLAVEISALLDSDKFFRMKTALFEAVRLHEPASLTHDGLGRLHRLEALVAEGTQLLDRYRAGGGKVVLAGPKIAQEKPLSTSSISTDTVLLGAIVVLGAVAITITAFLITKSNDRRSQPFLDFQRGGVRAWS